jgi:hypothetical protein
MSKKKNKLVKPSTKENESNKIPKKRSLVEFYRNHGIPSENTTHEKIGQTFIVFTKKTDPTPKEDDSVYASLRNLKYNRNKQ